MPANRRRGVWKCKWPSQRVKTADGAFTVQGAGKVWDERSFGGKESDEVLRRGKQGDWGQARSFSPVRESQGRNEKRAGPPSHVPLPPACLLTQVLLSVCQAGVPILKQSPSNSSEPSASLQLSLSLRCQLTERTHLTDSLVSTRPSHWFLSPTTRGFCPTSLLNTFLRNCLCAQSC